MRLWFLLSVLPTTQAAFLYLTCTNHFLTPVYNYSIPQAVILPVSGYYELSFRNLNVSGIVPAFNESVRIVRHYAGGSNVVYNQTCTFPDDYFSVRLLFVEPTMQVRYTKTECVRSFSSSRSPRRPLRRPRFSLPLPTPIRAHWVMRRLCVRLRHGPSTFAQQRKLFFFPSHHSNPPSMGSCSSFWGRVCPTWS